MRRRRPFLFSWIVALVLGASWPGHAQSKDMLVVNMSSEAASLDPHQQWTNDGFNIYMNLFDQLLSRNADGTPAPSLATTWRWLSETEVEFTLRSDVRFHDGRPLTAEDVAFSLRRLSDPAFGSPQLPSYRPINRVEVLSPTQDAPVAAPRTNLRDAAAAVLAAWDGVAARGFTGGAGAEDGVADAIDRLRAALAGKPSRTPRESGAPRKPREGTKQETVLALLRRDEGATVAQIAEATGWAQHTVRGFFAGLKKRQGIEVKVLERVRQVGPNKDGAKGSFSIHHLPG